MGLFGFIRSQFIEVIEWTDDSSDTIVYRFPVANNEIKMGASLPCGRRRTPSSSMRSAGRHLWPWRYQLSTANLPILTRLKSEARL